MAENVWVRVIIKRNYYFITYFPVSCYKAPELNCEQFREFKSCDFTERDWSQALTTKAMDSEPNVLTPGLLDRLKDRSVGRIPIQWISVNKTNHAILWIVIYPVDSVIHLLNNPALLCPMSRTSILVSDLGRSGYKNDMRGSQVTNPTWRLLLVLTNKSSLVLTSALVKMSMR